MREASVALPDLEPFRRELTGYCYRMLGSGFEAEDAVQEAMLRAWRNAAGFEGRSSLRSWLYRIATNVCIDMHRQVQRRARPMEMGPASPPDESFLGPMLPEATWVTPVPDARVAPEGADPAEVAAYRESVRLAFVTALQHLPPRQRSALILCEVLRWQVAEVAELLYRTGYQGWFVLEDESELAERDPDGVAAQLGRYVDKVLRPLYEEAQCEGARCEHGWYDGEHFEKEEHYEKGGPNG